MYLTLLKSIEEDDDDNDHYYVYPAQKDIISLSKQTCNFFSVLGASISHLGYQIVNNRNLLRDR